MGRIHHLGYGHPLIGSNTARIEQGFEIQPILALDG
jgi:hypothetical protein